MGHSSAEFEDRFLLNESEKVSDAELLSFFLMGSVGGTSDSMSVAYQILDKFGGLRGLLCSEYNDFERLIKELDLRKKIRVRPFFVKIRALREFTQRFLLAKLKNEEVVIDSCDSAKDFLRVRLRDLEHEVFSVLFLTHHHKVLAYKELFRGSHNFTAISDREVVKEALDLNAAGVILVHNHPSGVVEASDLDKKVTVRLADVLKPFSISIIDHFICGGDEIFSFRGEGVDLGLWD